MNRAFHILVAFCLFGPVVHGEEYHWTQGEIETNKIDLLLVFDRSAVEWLNDERSTNAEAYAQAAIADLNAALARTDLDRFFTFRLAGVETLKHSFSGSNPHELVDRISLMRRTSKREGSVFSKIRSRRNRAQADIVVILTDGFISNVYGSSNALKKEDLKPPALDRFKEKAYCFCDISSCSSRATLLHEIGHVMGAGHSADEWEHGLRGPQVFDYSAGYHFCVGTNRYATVMANQVNIESRTFWPRQPFFS